MPASLAGCFKVLIEGSGLSLSAYRDDAGPSVTDSTWTTISEGISTTRVPLGDHGGDDPVTELVQIDLYQPWRAQTPGDPAEDYTLADELYGVLNGALLVDPPMPVRSVTVDSYPRLLEKESNLVHHAYTVRVERDRAPVAASS